MTPVGEFTMSRGIYSAYVPLDTYTAQATFGDVRRGIANHKVSILLPRLCVFRPNFRTLNHLIPLCWYLETEMVEVVL